jgi:hypothetical protein
LLWVLLLLLLLLLRLLEHPTVAVLVARPALASAEANGGPLTTMLQPVSGFPGSSCFNGTSGLLHMTEMLLGQSEFLSLL